MLMISKCLATGVSAVLFIFRQDLRANGNGISGQLRPNDLGITSSDESLSTPVATVLRARIEIREAPNPFSLLRVTRWWTT